MNIGARFGMNPYRSVCRAAERVKMKLQGTRKFRKRLNNIIGTANNSQTET